MKKVFGLIVLTALVASFILLPKLTNNKENLNSESSTITAGLQIGDEAPDFSLRNIDGKTISLKDFQNAKGYIVVFTCNTCPYAVMYEDRLISLHNTYAPKGYPLIAIQPNDPSVKPGDSFEEMKVRAKDKGFEFPYLIDEGQKIYPQYGATRTPHVFLLDNTRKVKYIGAIDNNPQDAEAVTEPYLANAIAALEAGKEPDPAFTKAIGCSIKTR
jgi:peroxiredoxin